MSKEQSRLLLELAKELGSKPKKSKEEAILSLNSIKILTKKGKFTKHYKNLESLVAS